MGNTTNNKKIKRKKNKKKLKNIRTRRTFLVGRDVLDDLEVDHASRRLTRRAALVV